MTIVRLGILASVVCIGCGDADGERPATAPPLPRPILDAPCSEYDLGADGTVDIVYEFTYDDEGFMIRYVGTPMDIGEFTYDDDHFVLRYTQNFDADPEPDYEETYTRDRDGRVLTYQGHDSDGSGSSGTYTYDDVGRLVRSVLTDTPPGAPSSTWTTDYVYAGTRLNPVTARMTYASGVSSIVYTSSPDEGMLHADIDDGEDGTIDRSVDYTFDAIRRTIASTTRTGANVTSRERRIYNDHGHLTSQVYADSEAPPDDWEYYAVFDARGLQTERGVKSPSGQFDSSVYRETNKTVCARARTTAPAPAPRSARVRPSLVELPETFARPDAPRAGAPLDR